MKFEAATVANAGKCLAQCGKIALGIAKCHHSPIDVNLLTFVEVIEIGAKWDKCAYSHQIGIMPAIKVELPLRVHYYGRRVPQSIANERRFIFIDVRTVEPAYVEHQMSRLVLHK